MRFLHSSVILGNIPWFLDFIPGWTIQLWNRWSGKVYFFPFSCLHVRQTQGFKAAWHFKRIFESKLSDIFRTTRGRLLVLFSNRRFPTGINVAFNSQAIFSSVRQIRQFMMDSTLFYTKIWFELALWKTETQCSLEKTFLLSALYCLYPWSTSTYQKDVVVTWNDITLQGPVPLSLRTADNVNAN